MEVSVSNYDRMAAQARTRFLTFDQEAIIKTFRLRHDDSQISLDFVSREYRICRTDGQIIYSQNGRDMAAGFHEVLSICDMLCHGNEYPVLSGTWESISSLGGIIGAGHSNSSLMEQSKAPFAGKVRELTKACRMLGGSPMKNGDVSFLLPVFDFFPTWFQFWDGDEEYSPSIRFLWDKHTLRYLHYETLWYIMNHILERLKEAMESK